MKAQCKKLLMVLFLALSIGIFTQEVDAAPRGTKVMTITAKTAGYTAKASVYAEKNAYGGYDFEMDRESLDILVKKKNAAVSVSVKVLKPKIIDKGSLDYEKKIKFDDYGRSPQELNFQYYQDGDMKNASVWYQINAHMVKLSIDNLYLTVNAKGFHPGGDAYMPIQVDRSLEKWNAYEGSPRLRIRIVNSRGKYVYQKTYRADRGGYIRLRWNGKASKKNEAGVKAGSYVPDGYYRVEACYFYKKASGEKFTVKPVTAKKSFKVSSKTPSGTQGVAQAKELPIYTGNDTVDYLAECMLQEAGVTSSTPADEKVRKIYHYMTTHFKHIHYDMTTKRKAFYNTKKLAAKIKKYGKSSLKSYKLHKILYSYDVGYFLEENMKTRSGVCDDHADIFALLCKHVGIDAGVCSGYYLNRNGTRASHAWNYAVVNGVTWYYDVDVEIQNYGKGQGDYYWYKKTREQANQNHAFQKIQYNYDLQISDPASEQWTFIIPNGNEPGGQVGLANR